MSTTITSAGTPTDPAGSSRRATLTFGGVLRSEWIKLRTVRSTVWCYAIILLLTVAFGLLLTATFNSRGIGPLPDDGQQAFALQVTTLSIGFSQLVASVLGVLVISGEYGTGMIRSTFTAVPKRIPALLAKAIVFGLITFVVGLVSIVLTALITAPILPGVGIEPDFGDSQYLLGLGGGALSLALVGLMSLAIGAIVRNSAAAIATSLGLLLVVPTVLQILASVTQTTWGLNVATFLPGSASQALYSYGAEGSVINGVVSLSSLEGGLVMMAWVLALTVVAALLIKRRDV
ncbi:ABC transporter permease subunit [Naasia lichenicola]|uniref:ABC transporter permease n=1 Tax=Naasia lichenicola TaxID=2565933 RepID=A0A4S4FK30_9MICO|nr:ABC transporter permease subunit [Naasia lichenicola]THG29516.1 ABC transporter permease [Naasia lichenicola]